MATRKIEVFDTFCPGGVSVCRNAYGQIEVSAGAYVEAPCEISADDAEELAGVLQRLASDIRAGVRGKLVIPPRARRRSEMSPIELLCHDTLMRYAVSSWHEAADSFSQWADLAK